MTWHWEANKVMDPGSTNSFIDRLFEQFQPYIVGGKLVGAGGGGFAEVIVKDSGASRELSQMLGSAYPDSDVRVWPCRIAETGLVVEGEWRYMVVFLMSLLCLLLLSCTQPTDSTDKGTVERECIEVLSSITEDAVWESGKEYYVTGDVTVEQGATLTIQPDVRVLFEADTEGDYYGLTVKGILIADGGDWTTAIDQVQRDTAI